MVILASLGIASNKFREVLKLRMLGDSGDKADAKYINFAMRPDDGQFYAVDCILLYIYILFKYSCCQY